MLRESGAIRHGHFEYPNGMHATDYVQVALAFRFYQDAKILSVGLSRLLRSDTEIRALIPELSIVAPATGGLPVAYGVCEALRARQVYWSEGDAEGKPQRFRQYIEPHPGEPVVLVDDILRSGRRLSALKQIMEARGAQVLALAVIVYQPTPQTHDFGSLPLYYLARLEASYYSDASFCDMCKASQPVEKVWV